MQLNLEVCRMIATQYGLPLQFVIKEFHLFDILGQIAVFAAGHKKRIVFKGGTALNKIYLKKGQRFSEDLDFDLEDASGTELATFCRKLAENIHGYEISEFRKIGGTMQFYCKYETPLGTKDHVRVDLAGKIINTSKPLQNMQASSEFAHLTSSGILTYSLEDLTARKIHALGTRTEGKDVYDVYSVLPQCGQLDDAIECMLKSEKKHGKKEFLDLTISRLRKFDAKELQKFTNQFIPLPYRPKDWRELKNDLLNSLERLNK